MLKTYQLHIWLHIMVKDHLTANCLGHIFVSTHSFDYCYFVFDSGDHLEKLKFVLECVNRMQLFLYPCFPRCRRMRSCSYTPINRILGWKRKSFCVINSQNIVHCTILCVGSTYLHNDISFSFTL
jgi:hypothetical protein